MANGIVDAAGHNVDGCFSLGLLGSMVRSPVGYNPKRPHL